MTAVNSAVVRLGARMLVHDSSQQSTGEIGGQREAVKDSYVTAIG